jgi:hypothetical protein
MDFQFWIGPLALLVALLGVYYQRRQTKIMESQATEDLDRAARRRGESVNIYWWKTPAIPALIALVILAWVPNVINRPSIPILIGWGGKPGNCYSLINTAPLLQYANDYKSLTRNRAGCSRLLQKRY